MTQDLSSIDSDLGKLKSEPSDSSDLFVLNAALDDIEDPVQSVLSNSSDFSVLVDATHQAELNNYREVSHVLDSNSSESSVSLDMPAPRTREGTVVGEKRKLSFHELSDLFNEDCALTTEKSLNRNDAKKKRETVGVLFATNCGIVSGVSTVGGQVQKPQMKPGTFDVHSAECPTIWEALLT